jgi:phage terminase large subunit GpA-like protein
MLSAGEWVATKPENATHRKAGYHINSLYSPYGWYSWQDAAREWEEAQEDVNKMKVFVNTVLGETYKQDGESPPWENLYNRRETYAPNKVPSEVCLLTCGADVQADRIELEIVGWCKGRTSYSIDYRVIVGDTTKPETWQQLAQVVLQQFEHEDGGIMPLSMMAIDSGFNTTHVYDFCMKFDYSRVIPVKGKDTLGNVMVSPPKSVHTMRNGKKVDGLKVWQVNTGMIKSEIYGFLKLERNEDDTYPQGYCHFPEDDRHNFPMLTAEQLRIVRDNRGYRHYQWHKKYERNEALDCRVYARAAASVLNIDLFRDEHFERMKANMRPIEKIEPKPAQSQKKKSKSSFWDG